MSKIFTRNVSKIFSFLTLRDAISRLPDAMILESQEHEISSENRFSLVLCCGLLRLTETKDGGAYVTNLETGESNKVRDSFEAIDELLAPYQAGASLADGAVIGDGSLEAAKVFAGGLAGFISYDRQSHLPKRVSLPFKNEDYIGLPLLYFVFYPEALILDKIDGTFTVVSCRSEECIDSFIASLNKYCSEYLEGQSMAFANSPDKDFSSQASVLSAQPTIEFKPKFADVSELKTSISRQGYLEGLDAVHEEIRKGRVYQINYTQRFSLPFSGDSYSLYKRLERRNPAPYAAYINTGNEQIISSSPECFIKVSTISDLSKAQEDDNLRTIATRPIKGTIKRTGNEKQDAILSEELRHSEKDRSELLMIVDLERNDLGRISRYGSVKVPELFKIEAYPTLYHLVSEVTGVLRPNLSWAETLSAIFPGGSITGAPKLAAMECIASLEKVPRELYTGSIGFISTTGSSKFNIVIRTVICKAGRAWYSTGGGIVWDSVPNKEYDESLLKGKALLEALTCSD